MAGESIDIGDLNIDLVGDASSFDAMLKDAIASQESAYKQIMKSVSDVERANQAFLADAVQLTRQCMTAQEQFNESLNAYNEMRAKNVISEETYKRAVDNLNASMPDTIEQMRHLNQLQQEGAAIKRSLMTEEEKHADAAEHLRSVWMTGNITYDEYLRKLDEMKSQLPAVVAQQEKLAQVQREAATIISGLASEEENFAASIANLDEILLAGAISFEQYTARVEQLRQGLPEVIAEQERLAQVQRDAESVVAALATEDDKFAASVGRLDELLAAGAISFEQYTARIDQLRAGLSENVAIQNQTQAAFTETQNAIARLDGETGGYSMLLNQLKEDFQNSVISLTEYEDELRALDHTIQAAIAEQDRINRLEKEATQVIRALQTPLEKYREEQARLNEMLQHGFLTQKEYNQALKNAKQAYSEASGGIGKYIQQVAELGRNIQAAGRQISMYVSGPLTGIGAKGVYEFSKFDAAMQQAQSILGNFTTGMRAEVSETAKALSVEFGKSAADVVNGLQNLGSAGLNTEQALSVLPTVMKVARAGMMSTDQATVELMGSLNSLGMYSDDMDVLAMNMEELGNKIATTANVATGGIGDFTAAVANGAGAAAQMMGQSIESMMAVLATYASKNVIGDVAGSQFAILGRELQNSMRKNADVWRDTYKIETIDKNTGEYRDMVEVLSELGDAFSGLTGPAQKAALAQLGFQDRAIKAILPILQGSSALRTYRDNIAGAEDTLNSMGETIKASFSEQMKSFWQEVNNASMAAGETLVPMLTMLTGAVSSAVAWWNDLDSATQKTVIWVGALVAAIGPLVMIFGAIVGSPILLTLVAIGTALGAIVTNIMGTDGAMEALKKLGVELDRVLGGMLGIEQVGGQTEKATAKFKEQLAILEKIRAMDLDYQSKFTGEELALADAADNFNEQQKTILKKFKDEIATAGMDEGQKVLYELQIDADTGQFQTLDEMKSNVDSLKASHQQLVNEFRQTEIEVNADKGLEALKEMRKAQMTTLKDAASLRDALREAGKPIDEMAAEYSRLKKELGYNEKNIVTQETKTIYDKSHGEGAWEKRWQEMRAINENLQAMAQEIEYPGVKELQASLDTIIPAMDEVNRIEGEIAKKEEALAAAQNKALLAKQQAEEADARYVARVQAEEQYHLAQVAKANAEAEKNLKTMRDNIATAGMLKHEAEAYLLAQKGVKDELVQQTLELGRQKEIADANAKAAKRVQELQLEVATMKMLPEEAERYKLQMEGVSKEILNQMKPLQASIKAWKDHKKLVEDAKALNKKYAPKMFLKEEEDRLREMLKSGEIGLTVFRKAITDLREQAEKEIKVKVSMDGVEAISADSAQFMAELNALRGSAQKGVKGVGLDDMVLAGRGKMEKMFPGFNEGMDSVVSQVKTMLPQMASQFMPWMFPQKQQESVAMEKPQDVRPVENAKMQTLDKERERDEKYQTEMLRMVGTLVGDKIVVLPAGVR